MTTRTKISVGGGLALGAMSFAAFMFVAGLSDAMARTTPLGNATLGTSNSSGGANGVPSPSGPGIHPGYEMVSFRNAINQNWRFGGLDWLSDGRMVVVLWGQDVTYQTGAGHQGGIYGDIGQAPNAGGPGSMHFITGTAGDGISESDIQTAYDGLWEPLGLYVARSGNAATDTIYVMTKTGLLRFIGTGPYTNGQNLEKVVNTCATRSCESELVSPGMYQSFTTHAPVNYSNPTSTSNNRRWHHFNFDLVRGADGYFYSGTGVKIWIKRLPK
jgi:hypothetical protein